MVVLEVGVPLRFPRFGLTHRNFSVDFFQWIPWRGKPTSGVTAIPVCVFVLTEE